MTISVTKQSATPQRLVYLIESDGVLTSVTLSNARLLADAANGGPLKRALETSYANQAGMRAVFGGGVVELKCNGRTGSNNFTADVDTDATTPSQPEINVGLPATVSLASYLVIEFKHSTIR